MLALIGLALSQCESGRLVKEVQIPRYAPWCCAGESYVHFEDVESSLIREMQGKFVTVAPQTDTSLEFPTPKYLIDNDMKLQFRDDGNQTWENETAGILHAYLYMSYTNYPGDYPPNEPATANTYTPSAPTATRRSTTPTPSRTAPRSSGSTWTSARSPPRLRRLRPSRPCATRATGRST
jgi:hypothetical protein